MQKHPFNDKRIAALLADVIKCILNRDEVSFKEDSDYRLEIDFTVKDEHLVIGKSVVNRIKITET
jgi:hypothetical protein